MSSDPKNRSSLSSASESEIDRLCDRFEAQWKAGTRPRIKAYLAKASPRVESTLLQELLKIDLVYRRRHGEHPRFADYEELTPTLTRKLFQSAVGETTRTKTGAAAQVSPSQTPTAPETATAPEEADAETASSFPWKLGQYEILKELGKGAMGIVYLARHLVTTKLVALKLVRMDRVEHLNPRQRKEWIARFRTEARAAAQLSDDRVVTVYDAGDRDGRPYYTMRFVAGRTLAEVIKAGPLPNKPAAILMEQVARAVQAIHEQSVLHRDLKPSNILVDAQGRAFVSDFGLAKFIDAEESPTHTGQVLGTPEYMSPEQAVDASNVSEASDVYGLGATLYAVLTGRPPFRGKTVAETLHQVKYRDPIPPRRINLAVDKDLDTIIFYCLEKNAKKRYGSAAAVADELKRYLDGRPLKRRPLTPVGRTWRWCRRKPAIAALSAAAMVLLVFASALYMGYRSRGQDIVQGQKDIEQEVLRKKTIEYFDDMPRVQKLIDANDFTKARALLAQWEPGEGKHDYRGWEWRFLTAQCREAPFTVPGHNESVRAVAWSPVGKRLASADQQGVIKIWDVANSKELQSFNAQAVNQMGVGVMALAWSSDGKLLAAAGPKTVQIWEVDSRHELPTLQQAPNKFPPAGMPMTQNAKEEENEAARSRDLFRFRQIAMLCWNPRSPKLALADTDGKLQIWDLNAAKKDPLVIHAHDGGVHSAAWSPDGSQLASISYEAVIKIWDPAYGKLISPQGQLPLTRCADKYFGQELMTPTAGAAFHGDTVLARMLLEQRQREAVQPGKVLP